MLPVHAFPAVVVVSDASRSFGCIRPRTFSSRAMTIFRSKTGPLAAVRRNNVDKTTNVARSDTWKRKWKKKIIKIKNTYNSGINDINKKSHTVHLTTTSLRYGYDVTRGWGRVCGIKKRTYVFENIGSAMRSTTTVNNKKHYERRARRRESSGGSRRRGVWFDASVPNDDDYGLRKYGLAAWRFNRCAYETRL